MKKREQIKDQTVEELRTHYRNLSKDIYQLKNELSLARKLEKPHQLREMKKDRARTLTFLKQKSGNIVV